jgi:flagellar protein FliL
VADEKPAKSGKDEADEKPAAGAEGAAEGEAGAEAAPAKPKLAKKKLIIIIAVATVLLLGGAGAGLYFTGIIGGHKAGGKEDGGEHDDKKAEKSGKAVFYDLGDMIVNLSGEGRRPSMLKVKLTIELDDEKDKAAMEKVKPRVLDSFQAYMRELRVEDLKGSAGIYRLREELLLRVAEAAHPAKVRDVLITEMLVQ